MNKNIFKALLVLACGASFTACSNDVEMGSETMSAAPAQDIAGTYSGKLTANVVWSTDAIADVTKKTLFNNAVDGQVILEAKENYVSRMTTIGKDVQTEDGDTLHLLAGDATTDSLKANVNVFESTGAQYTLINKQAVSDPSLGMITASGITGTVQDGKLNVSFSREFKKQTIAVAAQVVNHAYGICAKAKNEKRPVMASTTETTTYKYSFEGNKQ